MDGNILVVDDDRATCEMLAADLGQKGFSISWKTSAEDAIKLLSEENFDAVLTDMMMPDIDGIELCKKIIANRPGVPVLVITAFGSMDTVLSAMRAGAYDFVSKPLDLDFLALALNRAVNHKALLEKVEVLSKTVEESQRFDELVGSSQAISCQLRHHDLIFSLIPLVVLHL